jgi:hypothetical protein
VLGGLEGPDHDRVDALVGDDPVGYPDSTSAHPTVSRRCEASAEPMLERSRAGAWSPHRR